MMKSFTLLFGLWHVSARSIMETFIFELMNWAGMPFKGHPKYAMTQAEAGNTM